MNYDNSSQLILCTWQVLDITFARALWWWNVLDRGSRSETVVRWLQEVKWHDWTLLLQLLTLVREHWLLPVRTCPKLYEYLGGFDTWYLDTSLCYFKSRGLSCRGVKLVFACFKLGEVWIRTLKGIWKARDTIVIVFRPIIRLVVVDFAIEMAAVSKRGSSRNK